MTFFKKLLFIIFFAFSSTLFASPNVPEENTYTEEKLNITATTDNPVFALRLKSNPTTGYSWFLQDYDSEKIQPVKHVYEPAKDRKLIGAPGQEIWTFHLKPEAFRVPQLVTLRLVYARPWEATKEDKEIVFRIATMNAS